MIFRNWVLQNFPFLEDDFDALTDYELFCKMVEYMKKSLDEIKSFQGQIDVFRKELDDFYHYFDNLDIQEEVNNKLDEMALDGTLENLIGQYIQLTTTYVYDNVATMKLATNLVNGSYARTSGFYNYNDGGGAYYKVRTVTNEDVIDEMLIIALSDDTLIAELVNDDKFINVLKCGIKNDGSADCSTKLNTLTENYSLYLPAGSYLVNNTINLKYSLKGDDYDREPTNDKKTVILSSVISKTINISGNTNCESQTIENINIQINDGVVDTEVIRYNPTNQTRCYINKISVMNYNGVAIKCDCTNENVSRGVYLNTATLFAKPYSLNSVGIYNANTSQDNDFINVEIMFSKYGVHNFGLIKLINMHIWCGCPGHDSDNWWQNTVGVYNNGGYIHGSDIYIDSSFLPFVNFNGITMVNNFTYWEDSSMDGSNRYDGSLVYGLNQTDEINTIINNGIVYLGERLQNINCDCTNTKFIYNSLTNFNFNSLKYCNDNNYSLKYTQDSQTERYLPVGYIENNGAGFSNIKINTSIGTDADIQIIRDVYNNVNLKSYFYSNTSICYYKIANDKIIIYLKTDSTDIDINVSIDSKSINLFPINFRNLIGFISKQSYQPEILTSSTGLTEISVEAI